jgi:hypothetical protein
MKYYPNRFGSIICTTRYLLNHFEEIKSWIYSASTEEEKEGDAADIPTESNNRLQRIKAAWNNVEAETCLAICISLWGDIPRLIKMTSGEHDTVPITLPEENEKLRLNFNYCSNAVHGPRLLIRQAIRDVLNQDDNDSIRVDRSLTFFGECVLVATKKSLASFDKNIKPVTSNYIYRFRFDCRSKLVILIHLFFLVLIT